MLKAKKINLFNFGPDQLEAWLVEAGHPKFRATQLMHWLYQQKVFDFDLMTTLSKTFRSWLKENCLLDLPEVVSEKKSNDGTIKWLISVRGGSGIETVYIPEKNRGTLCVSSQVGCALKCTFCLTGKQGFNRNLSVSEIISQLVIAEQRLLEFPELSKITNIVFMGMGEPLTNELNVFPAANLMISEKAFALSPRKVTISTSGIVPAMHRMKQQTKARLAVSLHACRDELRDVLVPINQKFNLKSLLDTCREHYSEKRNHTTFEYIMLKGINDTDLDCSALAKIARSVPFSKVNLIPFNPFDGADYYPTPKEKVLRFQRKLNDLGVIATIRKERGQDKLAACGQLAGQVAKRKKKITESS